MVDAISKEVEIQRYYLKTNKIKTLYFGGGTPSLLSNAQFEQIIHSVFNYFEPEPNFEFTVEANPEDLSREKLQFLKKMGVNRLSIGIQSFHNAFLQYLNRIHDATQAIEAVKEARLAGFDNISIDLIFAIPYIDHTIWKKDIQQALALKPDHISAYHLTIEPGTVFGNWLAKNKLSIADDQFAAEQFTMMYEALEKAGFMAYEISNYAKDGKISRHNSSYWKQAHYLGLGPGAHSYNGETRQYNVANNPAYIKSIAIDTVPYSKEELSDADAANEYIMTSLRTMWGCDVALLKGKYSYDLIKEKKPELDRFIAEALVELKEGKLMLRKKGRLYADKISAELFWI